MNQLKPAYDVVVVGSGFGSSMTALSLAHAFHKRGKNESILMLERGTWWTTPVGTVQDKEVKTLQRLKEKKQPVQVWSSIDHLRGLLDIFLRCVRRDRNQDGLYDLTFFGRKGILGFGARSDGITILRACGVGGGSLVYSNITVRPPEVVFDSRWPWSLDDRNKYFDLARDAISYGVIWAREKRGGEKPEELNDLMVNQKLSNIATRTARLNPDWEKIPSPAEPGQWVRRIKIPERAPKENPKEKDRRASRNRLWIDRARVFQTAIASITNSFGTVDSSINDIDPEPHPLNTERPHHQDDPFNPDNPFNYCERQGRCNIGCLPGARHTLNKQLMAAALGTVRHPKPYYDNLTVQALAEVSTIEKLGDNRWRIHFVVRDAERPERTTTHSVEAARVVLGAGCVGTTEIMLRSHAEGKLRDLSLKLGYGFSTNGNYLGFLEPTNERVNLARGPVTTSFGHFNLPESRINPEQPIDPAFFHTVEDNGLARPFAKLAGVGTRMLRAVANGHGPWFLTILAMAHYLTKHGWRMLTGIFTHHQRRSDFFESEDEQLAKMMCIVANGRDAACGQFRLGGRGETPLRLSRDSSVDGRKEFFQDPIYEKIDATLRELAKHMSTDPNARFESPFFSEAAANLKAKSVALTHALGGCPMAESVEKGVVDPYGRVFDTSSGSRRGLHEGLYIADGSIIPAALGTNPSLTIAALALRSVDKLIEELPPV